jgi:hypothetical protein
MIWMEGFDGPGTVAALGTKVAFSATAPFSLVSALSGTGSALKQANPSSAAVTMGVTLPSAASPLWVAFKFKFEVGSSGQETIGSVLLFRSATVTQGSIRYTDGGALTVHAANATSVATIGTLVSGRIYSIVISILPDDAGHCNAWLDGTQVVDADGDFKGAGSAASIDNIVFTLSDYSSATDFTNFTIDHLVLSDSEIPDCNILTLRPVQDGNYTQFTPSTGSDHFALVDEATLSTADFNASSTAGHRDSFKFTEPLISGDIVGVAMEAFVDKSDAGARAVRHFVRQGGTDYDGAADLALTEAGNIASQYYEVNPATSAAFTVAELTGASRTEFGVKVQS